MGILGYCFSINLWEEVDIVQADLIAVISKDERGNEKNAGDDDYNDEEDETKMMSLGLVYNARKMVGFVIFLLIRR